MQVEGTCKFLESIRRRVNIAIKNLVEEIEKVS